MAELSIRQPNNAAGQFYVDDTCIDCDMCRQIAPDLFERDDDEGKTYVLRQPNNALEEEQATEALDSCPTNSIGCDGNKQSV